MFYFVLSAILLLLNGDKTRAAECTTDTDPEELNEFQRKILANHNKLRSLHEDTEELCWSNQLAESAQTWADNLVLNGVEKASNFMYGENIHRGTLGLFSENPDPLDFAKDSVQAWYDQEPYYTYNFGTAGISDSTRKFTQLVWRGTTKVGCAYAYKDMAYYFVVCEYLESGNDGGQSGYHANVRRKISCGLPNIEFGQATEPGPYYLGQKMTVKCDDGYTLEGNAKGECLKNESFDFGGNKPRCTGCKIPSIRNGKSIPAAGEVQYNGHYVQFSCDDGYTLDDKPKVISCRGNELSSSSLPRCRKLKHCLRPIIEDGYALTDLDAGYQNGEEWDNNIPEGNNLTVICRDGWEVVPKTLETATCDSETFGPVARCVQYGNSEEMNSARTVTFAVSLLIALFLSCF